MDSNDHLIDPLWAAIMIFGGLIFCENCGQEASENAPIFTDEQYSALASQMRNAGWTLVDELNVFCPACSNSQIEPAKRTGGSATL